MRQPRYTILAPALVEFVALRQELANWTGDAIMDMQSQLEFLVPKNALAVHGIGRLKHLGRYVKAMRMRLDDMGEPKGYSCTMLTVCPWTSAS